MKKRYLFVLICSCFVLSGCTATYTLKIDEQISDTLEISMSDTEYENFNSDPNNYLVLQYSNQENAGENFSGEKIPGVYYYDMVKDDMQKKVVFSSNISQNKMGELALIKNTFRNYKYNKTDDELYIRTNSGFDFPYNELTSVKIVLESPYKVLYSNADLNIENKLIWNINKQNSEGIYLEVNYATDMNYDEEIERVEEETPSITGPQHQQQETPDEPETTTPKEEPQTQEKSGLSSSIIIATVVIASTVILAIAIILKQKKNNLNKI